VTRIGVVLGSTRPGRRGEPVARWVMNEAERRSDADFELVDLADHPLPHLDEPRPPSLGHETTPIALLFTLLGEVVAWSRALAPLRQVTQAA
jgi:NAD(P)H-dependent FMN reductase